METDILQICSENEWKYICANPGYNLWSENEARMACYQMGMVWAEGSGIVVVLTFIIKRFILYCNIELKLLGDYSSPMYSKTLSCSGLEEKLINCSVDDYIYSCYYDGSDNSNCYWYATAKCIKGILYY